MSKWRPDEWEKIKEEHRVKVLKEKYKLFDDDYLEAGFDAALEALRKMGQIGLKDDQLRNDIIPLSVYYDDQDMGISFDKPGCVVFIPDDPTSSGS